MAEVNQKRPRLSLDVWIVAVGAALDLLSTHFRIRAGLGYATAQVLPLLHYQPAAMRVASCVSASCPQFQLPLRRRPVSGEPHGGGFTGSGVKLSSDTLPRRNASNLSHTTVCPSGVQWRPYVAYRFVVASKT
jgi:hypothetical protein